MHPIEQIAQRADQFRKRQELLAAFKLETGLPDPHDTIDREFTERCDFLDAWFDWLCNRRLAVVLIRPHRWYMGWPGNYCEACGMDDPFESAIVCPSCKWEQTGGIEDEAVLVPCFFHSFLFFYPCEGYVTAQRPDPGSVPIARERASYPGRWFLVSSDGVCPHGQRWHKFCFECVESARQEYARTQSYPRVPTPI